MNLPPPEIRQHLIALHADLGQLHDSLDLLLKQLAENALSWSDLPELFALCGLTSSRFISFDVKKAERLSRSVNGLHELIGRGGTLYDRSECAQRTY
jgi:hypothetical protein